MDDSVDSSSSPVPTIEPVQQVVLAPVRPRPVWYAVGLVLVVGGVVVSFLMLTAGAFGYLGRIDDLQRVPVPGTGTIELVSGTQLVFHEPSGGRVMSVESLGLSVTDPSGEELVVVAPASPEDYNIDERFGVAIGEFDAPAPGGYVIVTGNGPGLSGAVAVGPSPSGQLAVWGYGAVIVAGGGVIGGAILLVVVRRRRRKALARRTV